jgi:hypothetical protein
MAWVASLLATSGFAGDAQPFTIERPVRAIRIRVYDYARVSPAVLERAKASASEILEQAGIPLEWVECRIRPEDPLKDRACELPGTPLDLYLHILDPAMAKAAGGSGGRLGFALLVEGFDSTASVYFHRALELEKESRGSRAAILGAVMAHEIGHLLLDQSSHAANGIMRAQWDVQDLKRISEGRMWFTVEQASRIASQVAQRERAQ